MDQERCHNNERYLQVESFFEHSSWLPQTSRTANSTSDLNIHRFIAGAPLYPLNLPSRPPKGSPVFPEDTSNSMEEDYLHFSQLFFQVLLLAPGFYSPSQKRLRLWRAARGAVALIRNIRKRRFHQRCFSNSRLGIERFEWDRIVVILQVPFSFSPLLSFANNLLRTTV